ncbi:MAG: alpha-galactosidase [Lentisphaeria bacterium]|nr:alpha-galactosidase [Lentisphaeria bacterium]
MLVKLHDNTNLEIKADLGNWQLSTSDNFDNGVETLKITLQNSENAPYPQIRLKWKSPKIDMQYFWHESKIFDSHIPPNWWGFCESNIANSIPIMQLSNQQCQNRYLVAVGEPLRSVKMKAGVYEEDNNIEFDIMLFCDPEAPANFYELEIRIDKRNIFYADAINDAMEFLKKNNPAKKVPESAFLPIYSTWYNFHQNLFAHELEAECEAAINYGIKGIIVDDGWQTDDNNRGYAFCGDWQLAKRRFPDMKAHVKKIHDLGMKYLMWLSVPFMGEKSSNFDKFKNMLLHTGATKNTGVLDPRFAEVREFLISTYIRMVKDFDLDGLKLDFIDWFTFKGEDPAVKDNYAGRDIKSLPSAVDLLMTTITNELTKIKPDILIEFRQTYIGSAIQKYGNMLRAADCPNDSLSNRVRTLRLRLCCGENAVHSDMIEWHNNESVEFAALQFINIIFSVPQISVKLSELNEAHKKMLKFYLGFWNEHRATLMFGKLRPYQMADNFPLVTAENENEKIIAVYGANQVINCDFSGKVYVVNGSGDTALVFDNLKIGRKATIFNAMGEKVAEVTSSATLQKIAIPLSGMIVIE